LRFLIPRQSTIQGRSLQFKEKIMPENINDFSLGSLPFNGN
jgi:hypothetical protein